MLLVSHENRKAELSGESDGLASLIAAILAKSESKILFNTAEEPEIAESSWHCFSEFTVSDQVQNWIISRDFRVELIKHGEEERVALDISMKWAMQWRRGVLEGVI